MASQYPDYLFESEWDARPGYTHGLKPIRTVAPATAPVSLVEIKRHVRVDFDDDNDDLQAYLDAAIESLDGYSGTIGRALITQTWRQDFPAFRDVMRLPVEPLQSVSTITYYDGENASQTLASSVYTVLTDDRGPYVGLKYGQTWPTTYDRRDAVSITFVVGYGAAATDVPSRLRAAIRLHAAHLYKYREMDAPSDFTESETYKRLVRPFDTKGN